MGKKDKKHYTVKVRNTSVPIDFDIDGKIVTLEVDTAKSNLINIAKACNDMVPVIEALSAKRKDVVANMDFDAIEEINSDLLAQLGKALIVCFGADGLNPVFEALGAGISDSDKLDIAMAAFMQVKDISEDLAADAAAKGTADKTALAQ